MTETLVRYKIQRNQKELTVNLKSIKDTLKAFDDFRNKQRKCMK